MNNRKKIRLILADFLSSLFALCLAFLLRFDFSIPDQFLKVLLIWLPVFSLIQVLIFQFSNLYKRLWRYTSLFDLFAIFKTVFVSSSVSFIATLFIMGP